MMKAKSLDGFLLSGIGFQYSVVGDVRPLVEYLRRELKEKDAADFIAKILTGEIKKGDSRKALDRNGMTQAQRLLNSFEVRRLCADHNEVVHGDPHLTDAAIYEGLDRECGYKCIDRTATTPTSERMIRREKSKKTKKG